MCVLTPNLSGVFTAIGGGVIRDIMVGSVPTVLKSDFYATAALIGGVVYYFVSQFGVSFFGLFLLVMILVTGLRVCAILYKFRLPRAKIRR